MLLSRSPRTLLALTILTLGAAEIPAADAPALSTDEQKTLYVLGLELARNLKQFQLTEADLAAVQAGFADGTLGRAPRVSAQEFGPKLEALARTRTRAAYDAEVAASAPFLAAEAAKPGVRKTASGLLYAEVQAGSGASPTATDTVTVHYQGMLRGGQVFDRSLTRGQPATFALNGVIPCWTEAIQLMKVGGKSRFVCPSSIAYGERGTGGIPPGAALVFEVELLSIGAPPPAK
jgi:FKBP-type peptidyl-prolyl cis-trans isomerase